MTNEQVSDIIRKVAEELAFNLNAASVLILVERPTERGTYTVHEIPHGSTLACTQMAREYVTAQDTYVRRAAWDEATGASESDAEPPSAEPEL